MFRLSIAVAALVLPGMAFAQEAEKREGPPDRIRSITLYGDEQCPKAEEGEVVVCARPEESPYRIPGELRQSVERPDATSWAVRVDDMMEANRAGLPNSCSPIGSGGQSGCTVQMLQQWRASRRDQQRRDAIIP